MQYISTTCAAEDAKFEAAIITETAAHIHSSLAHIVAEYGRVLTDVEKLTRVLEDCEGSVLRLYHDDLLESTLQVCEIYEFPGKPRRSDMTKSYTVFLWAPPLRLFQKISISQIYSPMASL